jgi:glycosidase
MSRAAALGKYAAFAFAALHFGCAGGGSSLPDAAPADADTAPSDASLADGAPHSDAMTDAADATATADASDALATADVSMADVSTADGATCDSAHATCPHTFTWTLPAGTSQPDVAEVRGTFNGWADNALPMTFSGGSWTATAALPVGATVEYKFWASWGSSRCTVAPCDAWFTDPGNPATSAAGNSLLSSVTCAAPGCPANTAPSLVLVAPPAIGPDSYSFQVKFVAASADIDPAKTVVSLNGTPLSASATPYDSATHTFTVSVASGAAANKYGYLFKVTDLAGKSASLFVPFWLEATPFTWRDAFIYEIMTDRFLAGGTSKRGPNGAPTDPAGDWKGGDFGGIKKKIDDGYFSAMGVNTLWISNPVLETKLCEMGTGANAGRCLSAYHSYFPIATGWVDGSASDPLFAGAGITDPIDPHFGTLDDLKAVVNAAHARGIRVLTDLVVNHVFGDSAPPSGQAPELAPLWTAHGTDTAWFNVPYNSSRNDCGFENLWDTATTSNPNRANCWFDAYLADFNTANAHVNDTIANHAVWLMQELNLDGFRVDAAKQVQNNVCVDLRAKISAAISTDIPFYMVGEALGGNVGFVMDCVGANMLDGSMNDPLHNTIVGTVLNNDGNAGYDLDNGVLYDESTWTGVYGNALMGHFFGSHDVPRAISIAAGNVGDAWTHPPPAQETNTAAFARLGLAQAFLLSYDSIPILWMGDEYGQPGSFDPDNRRLLRFDGALSANETAALAKLQKLGTARASHPALRRGNRTRLWVDGTFYAFARQDGADLVIAAFNFDPAATGTRTMSVSSIGLAGSLTDVLGGGTITASGGSVTITLPPLTAALFTR